MLALVGAVLLDPRDQLAIVGRALADRFEHLVDRGIAAVLVVQVDAADNVEIAVLEPGAHS